MGDVRAAMVLSAGLGTRLRPLTEVLAKPMVPVGDAPALAHVVSRVRLAVPSRIVVNVHHRPDDVRAWAEREAIAVSVEHDLLGTAGGVAHAASALGEGDVLVWNGDILSDLDPRALISAHEQAPEQANEATLAVHARPSGEGNVGLAEDGRVVRLRRESFGREASGGEFLGIHVVGARLRDGLPREGCLVGDVYLPALRAGRRLGTHVTTATFADVGTIAAYLAANAAWLEARGLTSWCAGSAVVTADVHGSVVGEGARVEASCRRCVVWPGAHVRAPIEDAVVTPHVVATSRPEAQST